METTKEFLTKLSKINFDTVESMNQFSGDGFNVLFKDKVTPRGATVIIYLRYEGVTVQTWGAWGDEAIEAAKWRANKEVDIDRSKREVEAIAEALAKKKFKDL